MTFWIFVDSAAGTPDRRMLAVRARESEGNVFRDVDQGVVTDRMEQSGAIGCRDVGQVQFVYIPGANGVDDQAHAFPAIQHGGRKDLDILLVVLGTAVTAFEPVGVAFHLVVEGIGGGGGIGGLGERELESVRSG